MWLLAYYTNKKVVFKQIDEITAKEELLNDNTFIEAHVFGLDKSNNNISLYLSKSNSDYIDLIDLELEGKEQYLDEYMYLREEFNLGKKTTIQVRNYYDYTSENILYIKSSRLVDVVVK